jgi:hypothetical protein
MNLEHQLYQILTVCLGGGDKQLLMQKKRVCTELLHYSTTACVMDKVMLKASPAAQVAGDTSGCCGNTTGRDNSTAMAYRLDWFSL